MYNYVHYKKTQLDTNPPVALIMKFNAQFEKEWKKENK